MRALPAIMTSSFHGDAAPAETMSCHDHAPDRLIEVSNDSSVSNDPAVHNGRDKSDNRKLGIDQHCLGLATSFSDREDRDGSEQTQH